MAPEKPLTPQSAGGLAGPPGGQGRSLAWQVHEPPASGGGGTSGRGERGVLLDYCCIGCSEVARYRECWRDGGFVKAQTEGGRVLR